MQRDVAMRVFTASFATETNTFSPIPTDRRSFEDRMWFHPGEHPDEPTMCSAPMTVLRHRAATEDIELVEGLATFADPAGKLSDDAYVSIRDEILAQLRAALPVDAVVLGLHGAMVAQSFDDCEGDLLQHVRGLVGDKCVVAAEMDPHCHLSPLRMEMADLLICFKEYSHIDFLERAEELVDLTIRTVRGEISPVMRIWDCRMIDRYPTFRAEMREFTDRLMALEAHSHLSTFSALDPLELERTSHCRDPDLLSISCVHGFMRADVEHLGAAMLVITDGDETKAARVAEQLGREFFELRGRTLPSYLTADQAIEQAQVMAMAARERSSRTTLPALIIDTGDNPGGGNPADRTVVLRKLIDSGCEANVGFGPIYDPQAVQLCHAAGEGATLQLRFGGKTERLGGEPIDALVLVVAVSHSLTQAFGGVDDNESGNLGQAALIRLSARPEGSSSAVGIDVILCSKRVQIFSPSAFSNLGRNPAEYDIIGIKSAK
eukprot:COSAG06_NODE_825_length_12067_cov_4.396975_4_plen_491_part_00